MRLKKLRVAGYRSIREELELDLDNRVTVLLGANDHGKSNLLGALLHLNREGNFDGGRDLNWDLLGEPAEFPRVHYVLRLSDEEQAGILDRQKQGKEQREAVEYVNRRRQTATKARQAAKNADAALAKLRTEASAAKAAVPQGEDGMPLADGPEAAAASALAERERQAGEVADAAAHEADALENMVGLAMLKQLERVRGPEFNVADTAKAAQDRAAAATTALATAEQGAATAKSEHATAVETNGAGSAEEIAAKERHDAATRQVATAKSAAQTASADAAQLQLAAAAAVAHAAGELDLPTDDPFPDPLGGAGMVVAPDEITLARVGVNGPLSFVAPSNLEPDAVNFIHSLVPRVELIDAQESLPDQATLESIHDQSSDFMRGIFHYAGLAPEEWDSIFEQTDATTKRLQRATDVLNSTLRAAWSQGSKLQFLLDHKAGAIDLLISDPAVENSFVRASRRSSGFTHFFALKTVLNAREKASKASSFLWLFDEPGVFLHPEGQHDLLQVLETLSEANQVIYATHSIFLANKNFPTRHRLITKDERGTVVDQKPFVGRWRAAIDALGLAFPGSLLFATHVLLVEGDSDPIILNADLQRLIEIEEGLDVDLNHLSIVSTGNSAHTQALIRILREASSPPHLAVLFDGDKGGSDRKKNLRKLLAADEIPNWSLPAKSTIEDYALAPSVFLDSVVAYVAAVAKPGGECTSAELETSLRGYDGDAGIAAWARSEGKKVLGDEPSSVGIAREYAIRLVDASPAALTNRERSLELAKQIVENLGLPRRTVEADAIVVEPATSGAGEDLPR